MARGPLGLHGQKLLRKNFAKPEWDFTCKFGGQLIAHARKFGAGSG